MAVTVADLAAFLNADETEDAVALTRALAVSVALLAPVLATAYREVPDAVEDEVTLEVAQAVFKRNQTPSGQFATSEGVVNVPRDPMAFAWPILRRYVGYV